jgi:hypothetical protein
MAVATFVSSDAGAMLSAFRLVVRLRTGRLATPRWFAAPS